MAYRSFGRFRQASTHLDTPPFSQSHHPVSAIAPKIGCTAQTLNEWIKKTAVDSGKRAGVSTDFAEKLKALERENRELRQANEILRKASAYFAQAELDRRCKP